MAQKNEQQTKKTARITFGPNDTTATGRTLDEARRTARLEVASQRQYRDTAPEDLDLLVAETVQPIAENERGILITLLQYHAAKVKKGDLDVLVENGELIGRIRKAVGFIELTSAEISRMTDAFKKMETQPQAWAHYPALMEQLARPTYKEAS